MEQCWSIFGKEVGPTQEIDKRYSRVRVVYVYIFSSSSLEKEVLYNFVYGISYLAQLRSNFTTSRTTSKEK